MGDTGALFLILLCISQPGIYLKILGGFFYIAPRVEKEDKQNEAVLLSISFPYIDNRKLSNLDFCRLSNTLKNWARNNDWCRALLLPVG